VQHTSSAEVDRHINQGTKEASQAIKYSDRRTFIACFSLAAFVAKQIQSYLLILYRNSLNEILAETIRHVTDSTSYSILQQIF
jgi:hypothetical protein